MLKRNNLGSLSESLWPGSVASTAPVGGLCESLKTHLPFRMGISMNTVIFAIMGCLVAMATFFNLWSLTSQHCLSAEHNFFPFQKHGGNSLGNSRKEPYLKSTMKQPISDYRDLDKVWYPGTHQGEFIGCDRSEFHTDVCSIRGNIHMNATASSFFLYASRSTVPLIEEKVKPYSRKWEKPIMEEVREITLKSMMATGETSIDLECQAHHKVPAVVFSTGGYTGNLFHEFNDGIIPLFITSQHLKGEVVFIIADFHNWWLSKYDEIVKQLSNYPVINFDNETRIHCFTEVLVGLFYHSYMAINSSLMPNGESMHHFQSMINMAYRLKFPVTNFTGSSKPRLVYLARDQNRRILNQDQIVDLAERIGFEVLTWMPERTTMLKDTFTLLTASDVVMGVHGAALTHTLFMHPGAVFIQIVPLGLDSVSEECFGVPAVKCGLQYMNYKIDVKESTLRVKYAGNDTVLSHPRAIFKKGWRAMKEIYLEGQDIQLDVARFERILKLAKLKLSKALNATVQR